MSTSCSPRLVLECALVWMGSGTVIVCAKTQTYLLNDFGAFTALSKALIKHFMTFYEPCLSTMKTGGYVPGGRHKACWTWMVLWIWHTDCHAHTQASQVLLFFCLLMWFIRTSTKRTKRWTILTFLSVKACYCVLVVKIPLKPFCY